MFNQHQIIRKSDEYEQEQEDLTEEVRKLFNEYVERVRQVERDNKEVVSEEELDSLPISEKTNNHPFRVAYYLADTLIIIKNRYCQTLFQKIQIIFLQ